MIVPIICVAVIAFLVVLLIIYFKEAKAWIAKKFGNIFKFKQSAKKNENKPKPEKKEKKPTYTVEDFKPIVKNVEEETRDSSIERLFAMDEDIGFDDDFFKVDEMFPKAPTTGGGSKLNESDKKALDEFFKDDITFKKVNNNLQGGKSISKQIKELSPEMKALLLDNVLKKRDDV